jgi:hypothetical protein
MNHTLLIEIPKNILNPVKKHLFTMGCWQEEVVPNLALLVRQQSLIQKMAQATPAWTLYLETLGRVIKDVPLGEIPGSFKEIRAWVNDLTFLTELGRSIVHHDQTVLHQKRHQSIEKRHDNDLRNSYSYHDRE